MKNLLFYILLIVLAASSSCSGPADTTQAMPALQCTDSCRIARDNTYEVYIPERKTEKETLPLLLILDPHGAGRFALGKFRLAADEYGLALVASNLVKNNFSGYEDAINTLLADVRNKYPVNQTIVLAGFSGGARMALSYALSHPVGGLVLGGALASPEQLAQLNCPVYSISGMDDFNFQETAGFLFNAGGIPQKLKIELTEGTHSWPDSLVLAPAVAVILYAARTSEGKGPGKDLTGELFALQEKRIDSIYKAGACLEAAMLARTMANTEPFTGRKSKVITYDELVHEECYRQQLQKLEKNLNYERSVRQPYLKAFYEKDLAWWTKEISSLDKRIIAEKDPFARNTYARIRSFLGIAAYSLSRQAVREGDAGTLEKILLVYSQLEPDNPDMFYFSAFIPYWKGDKAGTSILLRKAKNAGFSDEKALRTDFPGFEI